MSDQFFGKGITVASGFDLGAKAPLDARAVVNTIEERNAHIAGNRAYPGMIVYVIADGKNYQYDGVEFKELVADVDLSAYATIAYVDEQVANAVTNGTIDLSAYAKTADVEEALEGKVDKEEGKVLIDAAEAERLALVDNYDDAELRGLIDAKAVKADVDAAFEAMQAEVDAKAVQADIDAAVADKAVKAEVEEALQGKADKADLEGLVDGAYVDQKIADLVGAAADDLDTLEELAKAIKDHGDVYTAYVEEVDGKLAGKVDAVEGAGLMTDAEKEKLAGLENFDAAELEAEIAKKVDAVEGFSLVADDEIARLAQVDNYDDAEIREELAKKLEAIPEEYVTADEMAAEGFLKEHQDISHLAVKADVDAALELKADEDHNHDDKYLQAIPEEYVTAEEMAAELEAQAFAKVADEDAREIFNPGMKTVNALGGIAAGAELDGMTVREVLMKLLFPYVAPVVTATGTPNGGVFEKGNTQSITNVRVVVTKKSEAITKIEVLDGSTQLAVQEDEAIAAGGTFNYNVNVPVESVNKQLTVKVTDASDKVVSKSTGSFTFVYPFYVGVCAEDAVIDAELVAGLTKKVEAKGAKSITYTTDNQKMIFAYPKAHGVIKSVIDPNNFDVTATFKASEVSIVGLDGTSQAYYVYVNDASTVSDFVMKFNF